MRQRLSSAARMNDATGTGKRVRHQGARMRNQLTISLADATRCEAWEFMNNASAPPTLSFLSNDTCSHAVDKVKRWNNIEVWKKRINMGTTQFGTQLLRHCVTFSRLYFWWHTMSSFGHSKSPTLRPFSNLDLPPASSLPYHQRPQRPGATPDAVAFCARFRKDAASKASKVKTGSSHLRGDKLFHTERGEWNGFLLFCAIFFFVHA